MENYRIEILKDTPFHKKGEQLKLIDFKMAYGWICTTTTTNEELVRYLKTEWKFNQIREYQKQIGEWFKVVEIINLEPLSFIYEDIYYFKDFDGMYSGYSSPTHKKEYESVLKSSPPIIRISIPEVRSLIENTKFKQQVLYCTNDVNKKL